MFEGAGTAVLEYSGQVLLLWSDARDCGSQRELVDLLERHSDEAVIRSARNVKENTEVYFMGKQYSGNGIVRSCQQEASSFILRIQIDEDSLSLADSEQDPGIFAVESFLTEQQEAEILKDLEFDISYDTAFPKTSH